MNLSRDAIIRHEQAGGGGYGNPLKRSFDLIEQDLVNGKITQNYAERHHGVVFKNGRLDRAQSQPR